MGRIRKFSETSDSGQYSGIILWDLDDCPMKEVSLEVLRRKLPRLAHELGVPQPYRNLRIEIFKSREKSDSESESEDGSVRRQTAANEPGVVFRHVSSAMKTGLRENLNTAIIHRLMELTACPTPIILVSGELGTEFEPGPLRVGWQLFRTDMVVVCRPPVPRSPLENFLKARLIRTYGWPPNRDRDLESLLFHLDPAHEFPQGTNQVLNPVVFVAGVTAFFVPLFYSVLNLVM